MRKGIEKSLWVESTLNSYSQIFFSLNKVFACILLVVTFFEPVLGLFGLCAVLLINGMAILFGFLESEVREGIFGFNALLFGLAMGYYYEPNREFLLLFLIALLCLLVIIAVFKGALGKKGLPFLGLPFILTYWLMSLSTAGLSRIQMRVVEPFREELAPGFRHFFYTLAHRFDQAQFPDWLLAYFKTLSATFFVSSALGGILIAIGLLYFSRITFSLSLLGFLSAYGSYLLFGADTTELTSNLVGSNYIFFAIAIGGFYLIPNKYSYGISIILMPVLMLIQVALENWFSSSGLKSFTLSFSILTLVFLNALHQRWLHKFLHLVAVQYYSAEKTIYKHLNAMDRFRFAHLRKITLPFWGEWKVSQGYEGSITHLGKWSKAIDFVVADESGKTYSEPGIRLEDYYCYDKPVLAPADGYVYEIVNYVEDNVIGEVDTNKNWGNSIVINHLDGLYSQISHIRKDSFKVAVGDYVTRGTPLATCGSSGRSPEPHLHFQLQTSPKIGSPTLDYPISCFLKMEGGKSPELKLYEVPNENETVCNVEPLALLGDAFHWIPGRKFRFLRKSNQTEICWEVFTDAWNRTYLFEEATGSYAYFQNDGTRFYFTDFEGSKKSDLFHLYLSCYSVLLGYYPKVYLNDRIPLIHLSTPGYNWIQDFIAPFYLFSETTYNGNQHGVSATFAPEEIELRTQVESKTFGKVRQQIGYEIQIQSGGIKSIRMKKGNREEEWICVG